MRTAKETDFFVTLPDVGSFRYGRRTFGDRLAIRRAYLRFTEEFGDSDPDLSLYAGMIATHEVLCVDAPPGWTDLSELDVTDKANVDRAVQLMDLIGEKEASFTKGAEKSGEEAGAGAGVDGRVPVPAPLQPAAE